MKVIETQNLTKSYGKARGIIDMNLAVESGDIFGFIGPNGAGKSTTIRTLLGLIAPTSGNARIFGKDISANPVEILSNIGYMPSESMFYHGMRVNEILNMSAALHGKNCREEAIICANDLSWIQKRKSTNCPSAIEKKCPLYAHLCINPNYIFWMSQPAGWTRLCKRLFLN